MWGRGMGESLLRPSLYPLIMWTTLTEESLRLLSELIRRPSVSREEGAVADYLEAYLREQGIFCARGRGGLYRLREPSWRVTRIAVESGLNSVYFNNYISSGAQYRNQGWISAAAVV